MKKALVPILAILLAGGVTATAPRPAHAQLFGESDEEKAARQKHEDDQDARIAQNAQQIAQLAELASRITALEDQVRSLTDALSRATGADEDLGHRLDLLTQRLDSQQRDFSYRLCMLSAQQLGVDASGSGGGLDCAAVAAQGPAASAGAPRPQPQSPTQPSTPVAQPLAPPAGLLGTMPEASALPPPAVGGTARFDAAMNLLARAQYDEARAAFQAYADNNPDSTLTAQAMFWVGHIEYVQKNYPDAVNAFAAEIKKYPDAARTPDGILELGQSLFALGRKSDGCTALAQLTPKKYPQASDSTLAAAAAASKASDCRR